MQIILQCHTDPELKSNEAESVDALGAAVARFTQKVPTRHANGHYERPKPIKVGRPLHARPRGRLFMGKGEQPSLYLGLVSFGAPKTQLDIDDFSTPEIVFQIGMPHNGSISSLRSPV